MLSYILQQTLYYLAVSGFQRICTRDMGVPARACAVYLGYVLLLRKGLIL